MTSTTLGRQLGIDQKSIFHFVRVALELGVV